MKEKRVLLGAHMSIGGGLENALIDGASIGCTAIQLFTKSNRQWGVKSLTEEETVLFKETQKKTGIEIVVSHASYLINLASPDHSTALKSITALKQEIHRCAQLDIPYLVLHPGSAVSHTLEQALEQTINNLNQVLKESSKEVKILLETMAGQGSSLGSSFEQLAQIRGESNYKDQIGFCADTCHLFAAGYDFSTPEKYAGLWEQFDTKLGLSHLRVLHMNNSKKELGSRVDRHEAIDKGFIPLEAFKLIMNDERFFSIPKILETPKTSLQEDKENMETLLKTLSPLTRKTLSY